MSTAPKSRTSFSPASRWKIGLDVAVRTVLVLAVAVMVNFLGAKFYHRFYLDRQMRVELSSRTLTVLRSLTNHVDVTLYYDTHDPENFYPDIVELLNAYRDVNKNISLRTVDYERDAGAALKVKEQYGLPGSVATPNAPPAKDLIIFASGERHNVIPGEAIVQFIKQPIAANDPSFDPKEKRMQFMKRPVSFNGEVMFTSKLLALSHAQPLKAYYLKGHGEPSLENTDDGGYQKFALQLAQNDIGLQNLELSGVSDVPTDCSLLIIAAPGGAIYEPDLQKIDRYLTEGGKLMALFSGVSLRQPTGLEALLRRWGVNVLTDYVSDPTSSSGSDQVVIVHNFNEKTFVNPLSELELEMVMPRPVVGTGPTTTPAGAPQVDALVSSSDASTLANNRAAGPRSYPLITTVEQKPVAGVTVPRGNMRILVAGDWMFLDNQLIGGAANRDFLNYAANWLCDREQLLNGIGPRPVTEFRLTLSQHQMKQLRWLLLGALPGGVLILGWLVWLVRRK
ncbi:MAG TPA: GldG family protein [Verrucomicrobiae bacterium]|nr:GldG family protein [Verrucomicrobiae bacterium]